MRAPYPHDATAPTDPDTHGDRRLDGTEVDVGSYPLRQDLFVRVTYTGLVAHEAAPDYRNATGCSRSQDWDQNNNADFWWQLFVRKTGDQFPGELLSNTCDANNPYWYNGCMTAGMGIGDHVTLDKGTEFFLRPGESFQLYVHLEEL